MSMWLYQLNQSAWGPERYRLEIWEGERWNWAVGGKSGDGQVPEPGDTVVFFYAKAGGNDPGFYGWAIVLEWCQFATAQLYFRPTAPSDFLKMNPWWDEQAKKVADTIRGTMKQRTLWRVPPKMESDVRRGIANWLAYQD